MNDVVIVGAVAIAVAFVIARQLKGESLRGKQLVLLPVILIAVGAVGLAGMRHLGGADGACIASGAVIAAAIGVGQGAVMRLELRDGGLWGQLPPRGVWLWIVLIGSRLAFAAVAVPLDAHAFWSLDSILFVLGVNRFSQAGVIALRAVAAGIPFAAERDGTTFLHALVAQDRFPTPPAGAPAPEMPSPAASTRFRPSPPAATRNGPNSSAVARVLVDRVASRR